MDTLLLTWLCENLELPLFREGSDGVLAANGRAQDLLGGSVPQHLVTCVRRVLGDASDSEDLARAAAMARSGKPQAVLGPEGQRAMFVPTEQGRIAAIVAPAAFADISLLQQRASVSDRTAGVSHELANALGAIAGWARLARSGERVPEALELIERSAEGAWSTARQFLFDAGGKSAGSPAHGTTDISALVEESTRLIGPKAAMAGVHVNSEVTPNLVATGDRGALWTVLWNLVTNAVEAMPDGGTLTISLDVLQGQLHLTVRDTGEGMPESVQRRMFDPYFTTKATGAGIGLSLVRKTIQALGGNLVVHSTPAVGTRIEVWLPPAAEETLRRSTKRSSGVFVTDPEEGRYLVIDDDAILREMIATALEMRGAHVTAVASAEEALAQQGPFAAAIIDLLLTGWRGDRLLAELRKRGITDKAVLVSGTELPPEVAVGGTPDAVLRKPFDLDALFELLADLRESGRKRQSNSA